MYEHPQYWKGVVAEMPDEMLREWIVSERQSIPQLKEIASHGDPDSPIYKTIQIAEADLALYEQELVKRIATPQ